MSRRLGRLAGCTLLIAACASVPEPKGEVAKAELALTKAEAVNAAEIDPLDMRMAREKLEKAKLEMSHENYAKARRLAESAEVDAMLAEAKARSTRAQQATAQLRQDAGALRSESGAGGAK